MGMEIERKFLVRDDSWREFVARTARIRQGYLCSDCASTVRVRTRSAEAFFTIKGERKGIPRPEFEYPIPMLDALQMLDMVVGTVDKLRHEVKVGNHTWEVDEFEGPNAPLVIAEIELIEEGEAFQRPTWLGDEVSEDGAYTNSSLARNPFSNW